MNQATASMKGIVQGMWNGIQAMNVEQISNTMDTFEQQFEDLDVKIGYMKDAMNETAATSTCTDLVDELVKMVANENNLFLGKSFSKSIP